MQGRTFASAARAGLTALALACAPVAAATDGSAPIVVGLDADLSKSSAASGESIRRGALIAMSEINAAGGVLGRPLELLARDHRRNPARGIDNIVEMAAVPGLVGVIGGANTPVALAELETIHQLRVPYLGAWAAGTPLVDNGFEPNYVFRVSVRDEHAGEFLVGSAIARGYRRPGLLLWKTGWGRSNERAMQAALARAGMARAPVAWFNSSQRDMRDEVNALLDAGADVIMLVSDSRDGRIALRAVAAIPEPGRPAVIAHWGITTGDFFGSNELVLGQVDLLFLQSYSFLAPPYPSRAGRVLDAYCELFSGCGASAVIAPVGTAHAYDLVHLLARAIRIAGSVERPAVRDALERIGHHPGLVRDYDPPFTSTRHDALDRSDYRLARYSEQGVIVPVPAIARP